MDWSVQVGSDTHSPARSFPLLSFLAPQVGATLANSSRSEEALPAYHRALELKPKYARAWLNMGISHANLSRYSEAARCYIQVREGGRGPRALLRYTRRVWWGYHAADEPNHIHPSFRHPPGLPLLHTADR